MVFPSDESADFLIIQLAGILGSHGLEVHGPNRNRWVLPFLKNGWIFHGCVSHNQMVQSVLIQDYVVQEILREFLAIHIWWFPEIGVPLFIIHS